MSAGLPLIKEFEGLHLTPYLCPAGVPTIGWGSTRDLGGNPITMKTPPITPLVADLMLMKEVFWCELGVYRALKVPLSHKSVGALTSFCYNLGLGALRSSTLLRKINEGDWDEVPRQFMRWNKAGGVVLPGLTRRRTAEADLFMEGL